MTTALAIQHGGEIEEYTVDDIVGQVAKIQKVMKAVMREDEHYGLIPGCGKKPSLLKPGAEKLGLTFRLAPKFFEERRDLGHGHVEYVIRCELYSIASEKFCGSGLGSCSTMESKYRYRTGPKEGTGRMVPKEYWNLRNSEPEKAQALIGGRGFSTHKNDLGQWEIVEKGERVEHDNPADHYNTVLKIAKKRAHVDAILTATAASDIFTQDLEDLAENGVVVPPTALPKQGAQKPTAAKKQPKEEAPLPDSPFNDPPPPEASQANSAPSGQGQFTTISDKQRKRMYAIAKGRGISDAQFKEVILADGFESSKDVSPEEYDTICSAFSSWTPEEHARICLVMEGRREIGSEG